MALQQSQGLQGTIGEKRMDQMDRYVKAQSIQHHHQPSLRTQPIYILIIQHRIQSVTGSD
jgi:hypothetical protein